MRSACLVHASDRLRNARGPAGHGEARAKVSDNASGLPALWLLGNGTGDQRWPMTGEIDIVLSSRITFSSTTFACGAATDCARDRP